MSFIWDFEGLSRLCQHKRPIVRKWAINRLSLLYPERAGDVIIRSISDKDASVAIEAVEHFLKYPAERYKDAFLNVYKRGSGIIAGRLAKILAKIKDARLIDAFAEKYASNKDKESDLIGYSVSTLGVSMLNIDKSKEITYASLKDITDLEDHETPIAGALFTANLSGGVDIDRLLRFCYTHIDNPELFITLLTEIGRHCGSWYKNEDLKEEEEKGILRYRHPLMVKESLDYIESNGYKEARRDIERPFRKERWDDVLSVICDETSLLLEKKKEEYGEEAFRIWQNGKGKPRQNISAILAFKDTIDDAPSDFKRYIARTALSIFARLIEYRGLIGVNIDGLDMDNILHTFLQERGMVEEDERLIEMLAKAQDKRRILDLAIDHIKGNIDSWANPRIIRLIGNMNDVDATTQLLEISDDYGDLWEEIIVAIRRLRSSAAQIVKPIFDRFDEKKIGYALGVLEDTPTTQSADILIQHWERLWNDYKEMFLYAVEGIGDRRFIEPLKKELKEGEYLESEVYYLLCLINGVFDPQLKEIAEETNRHERRSLERLDLNIDKIIKEPVRVELKCRTCQRPYHYEVERVMIATNSADTHIMDEIRCKNCGVVDNYEITPSGQMAITGGVLLLRALYEENKEEGLQEGTFVIGKTAPIDGKDMSINEAVAYYEEKVKDNPDNPRYLIGYANTLRMAKRTEDAIPYYKNAISIDPLAIEAHVSLGDIDRAKGNYQSAYEYYKKGAEMLHNCNLYKLKHDIDQFKESVLDNLISLEERLGISSARKEGASPIIKTDKKIGRNDPCPCGSGKKYKKCCLIKEAREKGAIKPPINLKEKGIIDKLHSYSKKKISKKDFLNAIGIYFRTEPVEPLVLPERALDDRGDFDEWYLNDYYLPSGMTIMQDFYSTMFDKLTEEERKILDSYMVSYMDIYEVMDVTEGVGLKLRGIFTGTELEVKEVKGSQQLVKWDIIMARVYTLNGINRIASSRVWVIPRYLKDGLITFLHEEFERFKLVPAGIKQGEEGGKAEWPKFMKKRAYIVNHYLEDLPERKKILLTEERHRIILSKAHFDIKDLKEAIHLLEREYDFVVDEVKEKEARITWLKRGGSKEWQVSGDKSEDGMIILSKLIHGSGQLEWTVLGNINITHSRLVLECLSKERLERGKERLKEILGDLLLHKIDTFEDIEKAVEGYKPTRRRERSPELSEKDQLIADEYMGREFKKWVDEKIPALNGLTPREAIKRDEWRQKVIELIKDFENTEERKRKNGEPYFDVGVLKKELGLI